MAEVIFVTEAQVRAAQMLVDHDRALGRAPDPATRKIARARPRRSAGQPEGRESSLATAIRFWEALDQAEREALMTVASWQTFAPGDMMMTEGDQADHVIVIFGGRAKISVHENGRERVLAVRGLGQLIGERAIFQPSVRSATVTALELVWALTVRSEDFAVFVRDHPRVLDLVHNQIYDRLTEKPAAHGSAEESRDHLHARDAGTVLTTDRDLATERPPRRLERLNGENCTVVLSDVIEADHVRTDSDRMLIREALLSMTTAAWQGFPDVWTLDRGDGLLTVVPPRISTAEVMSRLPKELPAGIEQYNSTRQASVKLQLQLAVNVGPVSGNARGVTGEAIFVATRLLEASHFKKTIVNRSARLGIIISPFVYETFIAPSSDLSEVASYIQVPVEIRGSSTTAWMKVISRSDRKI